MPTITAKIEPAMPAREMYQAEISWVILVGPTLALFTGLSFLPIGVVFMSVQETFCDVVGLATILVALLLSVKSLMCVMEKVFLILFTEIVVWTDRITKKTTNSWFRTHSW